jgi:hypothetical protein
MNTLEERIETEIKHQEYLKTLYAEDGALVTAEACRRVVAVLDDILTKHRQEQESLEGVN